LQDSTLFTLSPAAYVALGASMVVNVKSRKYEKADARPCNLSRHSAEVDRTEGSGTQSLYR
jgi:hypothetical protein